MGTLANTAWAFATVGFPNAEPFAVLARAAERRLGDFNAQALASTAWAFATAGFADAELFAVLAKAADRCIVEFHAQFANGFIEPFLDATLWSFSHRASLSDACSLFENAKQNGFACFPGCFRGLLSECAQRGLR